MNNPVLVTSIPPYMKRTGPKGENYGLEYMQSCVDSWIDAGFLPLSVNSSKEFNAPPDHIKGVKYIFVNRDASAFVRKPLVYIQDMLRIGAEFSKGPFILTNADIIFRDSHNILNKLSNIRPGQFLAEKRIDISEINSAFGKEFAYGFDLFAFHPEDISEKLDNKFVFGVPWWDHYLPVKLILSGMERIKISMPFVYHLQHDERWDSDLWDMYGGIFIREISRELEQIESSEYSKLAFYKTDFYKVNDLNQHTLKRFIYFTKRLHNLKRNAQTFRLKEITRLNMRFIEYL